MCVKHADYHPLVLTVAVYMATYINSAYAYTLYALQLNAVDSFRIS